MRAKTGSKSASEAIGRCHPEREQRREGKRGNRKIGQTLSRASHLMQHKIGTGPLVPTSLMDVITSSASRRAECSIKKSQDSVAQSSHTRFYSCELSVIIRLPARRHHAQVTQSNVVFLGAPRNMGRHSALAAFSGRGTGLCRCGFGPKPLCTEMPSRRAYRFCQRNLWNQCCA